MVESNVRYPRENVEYETEVRPSPDQMMGCHGNDVCRVYESSHDSVPTLQSGQTLDLKLTEVVSRESTVVVSPRFSPGRSLGRVGDGDNVMSSDGSSLSRHPEVIANDSAVRMEPCVLASSGGTRDESISVVTSAARHEHDTDTSDSKGVIGIPEEGDAPANESVTGREGVHFKANGEIELEAKALGRSCFKVGDEGQILKVKVADQLIRVVRYRF